MGLQGTEVTLGIAFLAGLVSFCSPCVLPIIPAYLSLISGLSFEEMQAVDSTRSARWRLFSSALAFVLGFSLVTILLMGGIVTLFAQLDDSWKDRLTWIGGGVVIILALHLIGLFRIKALFNERRFHLSGKKLGLLGALLAGIAFAFGWSPCIGPILGSVIMMAASTAKTVLLVSYTVGLALPFLLAAVFVNLFIGAMRKFTRHLRTVEIVAGALLLVMGVLLVTGQLSHVSQSAAFLFTPSHPKVEGL